MSAFGTMFPVLMSHVYTVHAWDETRPKSEFEGMIVTAGISVDAACGLVESAMISLMCAI